MTAAWTTVVLGGARSGKSAVAEGLIAGFGGTVRYLATARPPELAGGPGQPPDDAWARRIADHRARRPSSWTTVEVGETGDLAGALLDAPGPVLVDSLGTWVASLGLVVDVALVCDALTARAARRQPTVIVSEEVGLGVHPASDVGRHFRDVLGAVNQQVAAVADRVMLVVAGRVLPLQDVSEVAP